MKKWLVLMIGAAAALFLAASSARPQNAPPQSKPRQAYSDVDGLALTPPMGWYPWNIFGEEPQNE